MNKTELLNKFGRDPDTRILLSRVLDKLETAENRSVPASTAFLSEGERAECEKLLDACGHPRHLFYGGYPGAERTLCVFFPDWQEEDDFLAQEELPVCAVRAQFALNSALTHRDFLGALMGVGITRECVGDILVRDGECDIVVLRRNLDAVLSQLSSAGRFPLKLAELPLSELAPAETKVKLIRDTVATLRLDAVMSSGFGLARSKASAAIESGKTSLNHLECCKPDRTVAEGDVISCRGLGKCVVKSVLGQSKKGRIMIELERYL